MKLEVGRSYRTRDDRKVVIRLDDRHTIYSMVGSIGGETLDRYWTPDGKYFSFRNSPLDLIAPWEDPLILEVGKMYKTRNGRKIKLVDEAFAGTYFLGVLIEEPPIDLISGWFRKDGTTYRGSMSSDLVSEWVEPKTVQGFLNVYDYGTEFYGSRETADEFARTNLLACVPFNWTEGEGVHD